MRLIPDWRRVLARAWSIRFIALAIAAQTIDLGLPYLYGHLPVSDQAFGWLTMGFGVAALAARLIPQQGVTRCP